MCPSNSLPSSTPPAGTAAGSPAIDLRIVAPTEVVAQLARALEAADIDFTQAAVIDPSYLGFDFTTAADISTIVGTAFLSDPLIPLLAQWFRPNAKERRIVVETPLGRVRLDTREPLTPEEVRERLRRIVGLL
jgi:hypothetical protein